MSNVATFIIADVNMFAFYGNFTLKTLVWTRICIALIIPHNCERLPATNVCTNRLLPAATDPTSWAVPATLSKLSVRVDFMYWGVMKIVIDWLGKPDSNSSKFKSTESMSDGSISIGSSNFN